jgi:hypothetical protein
VGCWRRRCSTTPADGGRKKLLLWRAGQQCSAICSSIGFSEVVGRWRRAQATRFATGKWSSARGLQWRPVADGTGVWQRRARARSIAAPFIGGEGRLPSWLRLEQRGVSGYGQRGQERPGANGDAARGMRGLQGVS